MSQKTGRREITDRLMAYGMIRSGDKPRPGTPADVVPITLDLIDAPRIPIENLIALRKREAADRRGRDYSRMRHAYSDMVQAHIAALGAAPNERERDEMNRQFRDRMAYDLKDLREALGGSRIDFALKPVIVATLVTGGALAHGVDFPVAAFSGVTSTVGSEWKEVSDSIASFFKNGFGFQRSQRETTAKHPMSYIYALSQIY